MIALIKNGIPHPQASSAEIIHSRTPELIPDQRQNICKDYHHSSDESPDSCEEKHSSPENSVNSKRTKLKVRSISDSTDEGIGCSPLYKGILKYKGNNRLRSLSESCAGNYSLSINGESNSVLDDWCEEEEHDDDDGDDGENLKTKKTVRFSNVVHKQLFRSNSSILGQRKKNQRKSRNKAKKHQNATTKSGTSPVSSSSVESDHADTADGQMEAKLSGALEGVNLCDSGIEIDDSDPGTSNPPSSNPITKKNKKKNRVKTNRRRAISESSSGEMIFDLDL